MQCMGTNEICSAVSDLTLHYQFYEKTLGIGWNIEADTFQFKITLRPKPGIRRGIISQVSSHLLGPSIAVGKADPTGTLFT